MCFQQRFTGNQISKISRLKPREYSETEVQLHCVFLFDKVNFYTEICTCSCSSSDRAKVMGCIPRKQTYHLNVM